MLGYTDKTTIEKFAVVTIDAQLDAQLTQYIESAEEYINSVTGRVFVADSDATARVFDGDGSPIISIDDCVEITQVEIGLDSYGNAFQTIGTTGSDRYFALPHNREARNVPFDSLEFNTRATILGRANVRVTAKWGYSVAVPEQIRHIANVLVKGIINAQQGTGDKISSEKIGNYSVSYDTKDTDSFAEYESAVKMLEQFKRYYL